MLRILHRLQQTHKLLVRAQGINLDQVQGWFFLHLAEKTTLHQGLEPSE